MTGKFIGIIPARYASTRFPGKPLVDIFGKTMIRRVYESAKKCSCLSDVWVATDDSRIFNEVKNFGGNVVFTDENHTSGTERVAEATKLIEDIDVHHDVIINIQGDEPFVNPSQIELLAKQFEDTKTQIATLKTLIKQPKDIENPNVVKVVTDINNFAMYFSRSAIPFVRDDAKNAVNEHFRHIGIYAYRAIVLQQIVSLPVAQLENFEKLEQLRWLFNGYKIKVVQSDNETIGIDTPEDLQNVLNNFVEK